VELALEHHVYSSLGGYRTILATSGLAPEETARAEEIARKLYRIVGARPQRGFYALAPGKWAALRGFQFGTDHAGRARTCVHTIVMREEDLFRIPWFNPFLVPSDLFIPEDIDLQYVAAEVRRSWVLDGPSPTPVQLWAQYGPRIDADLVRLVVPGILEADRATYVQTRNDGAFELVGMLAYALPPAIRRSLTHLDRAFVEPDAPPTFQVNFSTVPDGVTLPPEVEFLDLDRKAAQNGATPNAYTEYVLQSLGPGGNPAQAWKLVGMLELYEPDRRFSPAEYTELIGAFRKFSGILRADGVVDPQAAATGGMEAAGQFYRAGCVRVALGIMDGLSARRLEDPGRQADTRKRIRTLVERPNDAAVKRLMEELESMVGGTRVAKRHDETTLSQVPHDTSLDIPAPPDDSLEIPDDVVEPLTEEQLKTDESDEKIEFPED
jgi:hypothetical protein